LELSSQDYIGIYGNESHFAADPRRKEDLHLGPVEDENGRRQEIDLWDCTE
jgi:hypothetical protein